MAQHRHTAHGQCDLETESAMWADSAKTMPRRVKAILNKEKSHLYECVCICIIEFTTVTNAANLQSCNISNPGPLDQKPGLDQGLTVLLHESFYDS